MLATGAISRVKLKRRFCPARSSRSLGSSLQRNDAGVWLCEYPGLSFQRSPVCACSLVSSLLLSGATMSQQSSLSQSAHSVRQVLTAYSTREPVRTERRVPVDWVAGVERLNDYRPPTDVPRHCWRQFVSDCHSFLNSSQNWAERAAELGWDARALFGCHRNYPLMHLGSAGLLWAINGGKLQELHQDWAVIELPVNRQRTFSRRDVAGGKVILPWDRA